MVRVSETVSTAQRTGCDRAVSWAWRSCDRVDSDMAASVTGRLPVVPGRYDWAVKIIAHGIDAIEIERIRRMLADHGPRFTERCFTDAERAYADSGGALSAERYAARFAAKEAVMKALGAGWSDGIGWRDFSVTRDPAGKPALVLEGRGAEIARELHIVRWEISLTHTKTLAIASVIGCE